MGTTGKASRASNRCGAPAFHKNRDLGMRVARLRSFWTTQVSRLSGLGIQRLPKAAGLESPAEWTFARLMYPDVRFSDRPFGNWLAGGTNWTIDYPRSDRHLSAALRRLDPHRKPAPSSSP